MVDEDMVQRDYCWRQLANIKQMSRHFYTCGQAQTALEAAVSDRDNIANAVRFAAQNLMNMKSGSTADEGWWSLATIEEVTFLDEFLPADAYRALFDALQGIAVGGDPKAASRRCRALSAAAYCATMEGRLDRAAVPAAAAYDLLPSVDDEARAFCFFCLAVVCRRTDNGKAATLARRSLEVYRDLEQPYAWSPPQRIRRESLHDPKSLSRGSKPPRMGVKAIHGGERTDQTCSGTVHDPKSSHPGRCSPAVHASELLASILADCGALQSALNACRQSDDAGFQALYPGHPLTVRGYLVRQRLWTTLGLMERARQAAVKAAEAALIYYAEEHPGTGHALACLCDSTSHRGPVDDSICDAIHALAVRIKVCSPSLTL